MATKLSTITTQFRRFTKNQVLTEGQLNEVIDYFDDQDRLTRICLSGVGIVCGFNVTFNNIIKKPFITITQGTGITTDGDLFNLYEKNKAGNKIITISSKNYTFYKVYNNKKALYKPFFYNGKDQLQLFELLTPEDQKNEKEENFPLSAFETNQGFSIKDAVTLLYLETYEKDLDLCVSLSCDNQGLETIGNYKVLMVSKNVATQINSHDSLISQVNYSNLYYQLQLLPDVKSNRIVLKPENFVNYNEVKKAFTTGLFKNNTIDNLLKGYNLLLITLQVPELFDSIKNNITNLFSFSPDNVPPDFQYRYDVLKDVIDTYNETLAVLHNLEDTFCFPNTIAFPKHLMLGEVVKNGPCFEYRHAFYKSPLLTDENLDSCNDCLPLDSLIQYGNEKILPEIIVDNKKGEDTICYNSNNEVNKLNSLIKRSVQLLENYNANFGYIKITPSLQLGNLGKKAIPFYNNLGEQLIRLWDFDKTVVGKQRDNVSYHDNLLNTKRPLEIILDHNFYRIEGHQGRDYKEVLKIMEGIRRENGLGFNIAVIGISAEEAIKKMDPYTDFYLNKNHGFEHKAGVPPGGTFILVYIQGEYNEFPYPYGYGYPYGYPNSKSLAGDFEEISKEEIILNPIIADFTLPYLCCDENFITLSLPIKKLCFDQNTPTFPFHVTPTGGFVKADVDEELNGGVTINQFGEFIFDPNLVSEELIGQEIAFTVNNFETNCRVTVYNKPIFDFDAISKKPPGTTAAEFIFSITTINAKGITYTWDFGDGSKFIETKETIISHTYRYKPSAIKKHIYDVTVIASNKNCNYEVKHRISFEVIDPKISIDSTTICRDDKTDHVFTIEPKDAEVVISGEGISKNKDGQYVFNASTIENTTNTIIVMVDGVASNIIIAIQEPPIAAYSFSITQLRTGDFLTLQNNSKNATKYNWKIANEVVVTDNQTPITRPLSNYKENAIEVTLEASNDFCAASIDSRSIIIREEITPTISIEKTSICRNDIKEYPFTIMPTGAKVTISGEGVYLSESKNYVFNATKADKSITSVFLMVNGKQSDLVITILEPAEASFTSVVEKESLVLSNTSKNAEGFIWNIDGKITKKKDTGSITVPITNIDKAFVTVSLTATNSNCGESIDGPRDIAIKNDTSECVTNFASFVKTSINSIDTIKNSNQQLSSETVAVLNTIDTKFQTINKDLENFSNGSNNNQLTALYTKIPEELAEVVNTSNNLEEIPTLRTLTELSTFSIYNILRCQDVQAIENFTSDISSLLVRYTDLIKNVDTIVFNKDDTKTILQFLTDALIEFEEFKFINVEIQKQIEILQNN